MIKLSSIFGVAMIVGFGCGCQNRSGVLPVQDQIDLRVQAISLIIRGEGMNNSPVEAGDMTRESISDAMRERAKHVKVSFSDEDSIEVRRAIEGRLRELFGEGALAAPADGKSEKRWLGAQISEVKADSVEVSVTSLSSLYPHSFCGLRFIFRRAGKTFRFDRIGAVVVSQAEFLDEAPEAAA